MVWIHRYMLVGGMPIGEVYKKKVTMGEFLTKIGYVKKIIV